MKLKWVMKILRLLIFSIVLFSAGTLICQDIIKPNSSSYYLNKLDSSKNVLYNEILELFNDYHKAYPQDLESRIDLCKIINGVFYDPYGDYNPNEEIFYDCIDSLLKDFPFEYDAVKLKLEYTYGDSAISFCHNLIESSQFLNDWNSTDQAYVFNELANQYNFIQDYDSTIKYARKAESLNDSLDLSYVIANIYYQQDKNGLAKKELLLSLDSLDTPQQSLDKAELLLKLGLIKESLKAYENALRDSTLWIDNSLIAEAYVKNDSFERAREYLVKELNGFNSNLESTIDLFNHDYKHSSTELIKDSYTAIKDFGFWSDPFGVFRLKMSTKSFFYNVQFIDLFRILMLVIVIGFFILIPYLWILPIYFCGQKINFKRHSIINHQWTLKHFWIASSILMLMYFLSLLVFNYKSLVEVFSDSYFQEIYPSIDKSLANEMIFFSLGMLAAIILLLRKSDFQFLLKRNWSYAKSIFVGVGIATLLRIVYFSFTQIGFSGTFGESSILIDSIAATNEYYSPIIGFAIVALIVPFYEEYLFRGIILWSVQSKLNFIFANVIQSLFFALLHENLEYFFFYFLFGMIAGILFKRSGSILASISFHVTNNAFAFWAITNIS